MNTKATLPKTIVTGRKILIAIITFAIALSAANIAIARDPYRKAFFQAYPQAKSSVLDDVNSHPGHCGVCHYDFGGSGPKNFYGQAVEATDRSRDAILGLGGIDSDGDGFTNDQEITDTTTFINTPTFPGLTPINKNLIANVDAADIETYLVPSVGLDINAPDVVVLVPNGGESYVANVNDTVQWTASDTGGIAAIDLYISLDNGATFKPIELGLANTGSYDWFPANRPTTQAILRVVATDNSFNKGQDDSNAVFTIVSPPIPPSGTAPTTLRDFDQPGSQPFEAGLLNVPQGCAGCHGDYDPNVEPYRNWQGSMMAQASIDPLFKANMAIANQDAPDSGDLCLRCHFIRGWVQGRSVPTDGSRMQKLDEGGVACDFCHRLVDPIHDPCESPAEDAAILAALSFPASEFGNGMATLDTISSRRGPFLDADSGHNVIFSPFHREAALCGTCHDVSNPAFEKDGNGNYMPNAFDAPATDFSPHTLLPVERTYSEWFNSAYNTLEGIYAPQFGGNKDYVATCQDCHMRDVTGVGCNLVSPPPPTRSDLPLHDMTGGSTWLPGLLSTTHPNDVNDAAMQAGIARARYMLQNAANLEVIQGNELLEVTVTNNTGHKLPTGYPEGRRVWINVKFYDFNDTLISESAAYDQNTGYLSHDTEAKIYEIEPGIDPNVAAILGLPSGPSFHFTLNNKVYKDNRIPPRGFTNAAFAAFGGSPVDYSYEDGQYWDQTDYQIPVDANSAQVKLYYQSTSKEFIEFLRDENTTTNDGNDLYQLWNDNGKCPPELMQTASIVLAPRTRQADLSGNSEVDFIDYAILASYWLNDCTSEDCGQANLDDGDQVINESDLRVFVESWLWGKHQILRLCYRHLHPIASSITDRIASVHTSYPFAFRCSLSATNSLSSGLPSSANSTLAASK
jgi:cytochrome c553